MGGVRLESLAAGPARVRWFGIAVVESSRIRTARVEAGGRAHREAKPIYMRRMTDDIVQRIERFHFPRGDLVAERRNRGYTLYHALSGSPVARLRPTGSNDSVEILYWSAWKQRWAATGPFGRTILPVDEALDFIAHENIFWVLC